VYVKAEIYLDGGAPASSTPAMVGNAGTIDIGPYDVPNIAIDAWGVYTNNPPCGVVRGFGSVQAAYVAELPCNVQGVIKAMEPCGRFGSDGGRSGRLRRIQVIRSVRRSRVKRLVV
jgi:Molybdopterin cofactor-binding domain